MQGQSGLKILDLLLWQTFNSKLSQKFWLKDLSIVAGFFIFVTTSAPTPMHVPKRNE